MAVGRRDKLPVGNAVRVMLDDWIVKAKAKQNELRQAANAARQELDAARKALEAAKQRLASFEKPTDTPIEPIMSSTPFLDNVS